MSVSMTERTVQLRRIDPSAGVSEIIGAILMISLVVLGVAIVAMLFFSQTTPSKIPSVNFMTGTMTDREGQSWLYLYHNGGDSLPQGTFSVLVDGAVQEDYRISDNSPDWSLGTNLILPVDSGSHTVAIIYNATGTGAVVLRSGSASNISPSKTFSPDVRVGTTYPPLVSTSNLMQNVTNNSLNYYRVGGTRIASGSIRFNVTTDKNSTMVFYTEGSTTPTLIQLNIGNNVVITPYSDATLSPNVRVICIGDQILEFSADKVESISITNRSGQIPDTEPALMYPNVILNHTWVTGYKNLESTLVLAPNSDTTSYYTQLSVNRYPSYESSQTFSSQIINWTSYPAPTINTVGPTATGIFILQYDNRTQSTYFFGGGTVA
jgi:FlaG/FlaF family flagellin (archaellin)